MEDAMKQSKKTRLQELRQEVRTCSDPYELTAILALDNERLRSELAKLQTAWDGKAYARNRYIEYPAIEDQLDMMYHDRIDGTTTWRDAITAVKNKYRKP